MKSNDQPSADDRRHMRRALSLARRGLGKSSPNPAVGAVVVKGGRVVGQGYHARAGGPHAEVIALRQAGPKAKGATLYLTLEPCHHKGRTPPCTQAILQAGVSRVVYGAADPNPKVAGGGGDFLRKNGVEVFAGALKQKCAREHRFFFTHITTGRPHVILKTAATMDGKTAAITGDSRWVTGESARCHVHRLRRFCDAICVGIGTALADDPQLTCRLKGGRDPVRVVVDTELRLPLSAKVLDRTAGGGCLVACGARPSVRKRKALEESGACVLALPRKAGGVDLAALLKELGKRGLTSLLVEGGAALAWGFLSQGLVDEVMYFFAPKIIGGENAPSMVGGQGFAKMAQALELEKPELRRFGDDVMFWAQVIPKSPPKGN